MSRKVIIIIVVVVIVGIAYFMYKKGIFSKK